MKMQPIQAHKPKVIALFQIQNRNKAVGERGRNRTQNKRQKSNVNEALAEAGVGEID